MKLILFLMFNDLINLCYEKIFNILLICSIVFTSCKVVDSGEVGIKFK
jgi:hypothetical protein